MKKFFFFGKKKKKANEQKEKEEEGYDAVDDDYDEEEGSEHGSSGSGSGSGDHHHGGENNSGSKGAKPAEPSSPLRVKRDPRARFSTNIVTISGGGDSIAASAARLSASVAGSSQNLAHQLSSSGGGGSSSGASSSTGSLTPGAASSSPGSSTSSSASSSASSVSSSSSPSSTSQLVSETDGVKRKVAAFAALSAANAAQPAPVRGSGDKAPAGRASVSGLSADPAASIARSTAARRAELQRTRSHTTKREDLMLNSSMPSKEKIELLWSKHLREQDLPNDKKEAMKKWSSLDKWKALQQLENKDKAKDELILERKRGLLSSGTTPTVAGMAASSGQLDKDIKEKDPPKEREPEKSADARKGPAGRIMDSPAYYINALQTEFTLRLIEALKQTLTTQPTSWQQQFEKLGGFTLLLKSLADLQKKTNRTDDEKHLITGCISCLKAVMNNKYGLGVVMQKEGAMKTIALGLDHPEVKTKIMVLELLTIVCMVPPNGHKLIVEAMTNFKAVKREKARFNQLLIILKKSKSIELKTNALAMVNAIVNVPADIDMRMHYRNEFIRLGIKRILKALKREQLSVDLATQIEVYDEESRCDQEELDQRFLDLGIDDVEDVEQIFSSLSKSAKSAGLGPSLLSLLRHLCLFPMNEEVGVRAFVLAERLVQQVALQKSNVAFDESGAIQVSLEELTLAAKGASDTVTLHKKIEALQAKLAASKEKKKLKDQSIIEKEAIIRLMEKQRQADQDQLAKLREAEAQARKEAADAAAAHREMMNQERAARNTDKEQWVLEKSEWAHEKEELVNSIKLLQEEAERLKADLEASNKAEPPSTQAETEAEPPPLPATPRSDTNGNTSTPQKKGSTIVRGTGSSGLRSSGSVILRSSGSTIVPPLPPTPIKSMEAVPTVDEEPPTLPPSPGRPPSKTLDRTNISSVDKLTSEEYKKMKELLEQLLGRDCELWPVTLKQLIDQKGISTVSAPATLRAAPEKKDPAPSVSNPTPSASPASSSFVTGTDTSSSDTNVAVPAAPEVIPGPPPPGPPPPGPPPPGPPPPPGGGAPLPGSPALLPKRKIQKPSIKLKGYQWVKLPDNKIKSTIWGNLDFKKQINFDWNEIEEMFAANPLPTKEKSESTIKHEARANIINPKKSQNIAIMLARLKQPYDVIKKAILSLDETVLSKENIRVLHAFGPTAEEIEQIKEYLRKDSEKPADLRVQLADPEQFFLELSTITNLDDRLKFFIYKLEFADKLAEIRPGVETVRKATAEFKSNAKWMQVLELVLFLGNFVNEGTFRGGINGFKLSSLQKMMDVRGADNRTTLLHYLAKIMRKEHMHLMDFTDELSHCGDAARVSLSALKAEFMTLKKDLQQLEASVQTFQSIDLPEDRFIELFNEFNKRAKDVIYILDESLVETEELFKSVLTLYAEDPQCDPEEFFTTVSSFCSAFERAAEENEREMKAAERAAKRAALKEEKEAKMKTIAMNKGRRQEQTSRAGALNKAPQLDEEDEGVVDDILNTLREGQVFRHRRRATTYMDENKPNNNNNIAMSVLADFTRG